VSASKAGYFPVGFLCCSAAWGGLELNVLRLALWLRQSGWPIIIYGRAGSPLLREAEKNGVPTGRLNPGLKYGGPMTAARLARMIARDRLRTVVIHTNRDVLIAALARLFGKCRVRLFFMQHMQLGVSKRDPLHTWQYAQLDAWITPLEILADDLKRKTRLDHRKIHVVPFGIELDRFTDKLPSRTEARNRLALPAEGMIVGTVGRIDPKKGQDTLIRAAHHLHGDNLPVHVLLIGEETSGESDEYSCTIRKLVQELHLDAYVHFRGYREDIHFAYAAMDLFALTSHSETYGMVTIEAMASARPVIATDSGGTPGIIRHGENGLLIPPADSVALAGALRELLCSRDLATRLAHAARSDACRLYSHESERKAIQSLFRSEA
jgi:glycosyltransferase involved in cell wall biosynthesis